MVIIDIARAFERVSVQQPLKKLNNYGVMGHSLWLISRMLKGSVLGPLLFLLFIKDLNRAA